MIDRYAESAPREVSAILLSPWPERLYTFEQMWLRLADHDPGVLPVNGDYLHERIHHNKFDKVNAGHFAWTDVADEYADLIIDWWEGGYEGSLRSR